MIFRGKHSFGGWLMLASVWLAAPTAFSQGIEELADTVAKLNADLAAATDLDAAAKQQVSTLLESASANIKSTKELELRIQADLSSAKAAADDAEQAEKTLRQLQSAEPKSIDESQPIEFLEKQTSDLRQQVDKWNVEMQAIDLKINTRISRSAELIAQLESADQQIAQASEAIQLLPELDPSLKAEATRVELHSQLIRTQSMQQAAAAEQQLIEAEERYKLLKTARDLLSERIKQGQQQLANLDQILAAKRNALAKEMKETAEQQQKTAQNQYPQLTPSFKINTERAKRLEEIVESSTDAQQQRDRLTEEYRKLQDMFRESRTRVATYGPSRSIGLSSTVGAMLRTQKAGLPNDHGRLVDADQLRRQIEEIQSEYFDLNQQLDELSIEKIREEVEAHNPELAESDWAALEAPVKELLAARRSSLDSLSVSALRLLELLFEVESTDRNIVLVAESFRDYINERILWIQSNGMLFSEFAIDDSDLGVLKASHWTDSARRTWTVIQSRPIVFCLAGLAIVVLMLGKSRLRREVDAMGEIAARGSCETYWPTTRALVLTALIAATTPMVPFVLGAGLRFSPSTTNNLFDSLSPALLIASAFAFPLEVLRRLCRTNGLAARHFDWSDKTVTCIRTNLAWFVLPASVTVFAVTLLYFLDTTHQVDLIERLLFIVGMAMLGALLYRLFNPASGIFSRYLKANEASWANQTSAIWFGFMLLVPFLLAVLTFFGYYYTALNLAKCAFATFVFAVVAEIVRALVKRFVLVRRRRAHIQAARKKREALLESRREEQRRRVEAQSAAVAADSGAAKFVDTSAPAASIVANPESLADIQPALDIDENAVQANKLVDMAMLFVWAAALWMIWIDVLPAVKALDNFTVWDSTIIQQVVPNVGSAAVDSSASTNSSVASGRNDAAEPETQGGGSTVDTNDQGRVTIRDILVFLLIAMVTLVSARNLPNALEMLFLEHLPVDRSARYATKALFSYAIVMIGMILAFRTLSISWTNVQWLATALTFGLAFGLQEIFANFVAGIILMFERPIRIGDWITVDEHNGIVTKIRTRATTILNWDRKEYVIPNKDFITGRVTNWTLSDSINRIVINVGVAYGSNIEQAKALLYEICGRNPHIVKDPPTHVAFDKFGESSLNLSIRTFINDVDKRLPVIDELHTQIDQVFRAAGIELSFPQRDLHIRSIDKAAAKALRSRSAGAT